MSASLRNNLEGRLISPPSHPIRRQIRAGFFPRSCSRKQETIPVLDNDCEKGFCRSLSPKGERLE